LVARIYLLMNSTYIITIDGPAASGISTLSWNLAKALGWSFLDTGALYRAVAVAATEKGVLNQDPDFLGKFAWSLKITVTLSKDLNRVFIDGREVTELLRTPEISRESSRLSAIAEVRKSLRALQKTLGDKGYLVSEGRDQGSAIFPQARLKFFLTASQETRARRRLLELGTAAPPFQELFESIKARDLQDSSRPDDPLVEPHGAVKIDSSHMERDEVLNLMLAEARREFSELFQN
jgi:cytidylate kinase